MILVKNLLNIVKCTFRRLFVQLNDPLFTRHLNNFLISRSFLPRPFKEPEKNLMNIYEKWDFEEHIRTLE